MVLPADASGKSKDRCKNLLNPKIVGNSTNLYAGDSGDSRCVSGGMDFAGVHSSNQELK